MQLSIRPIRSEDLSGAVDTLALAFADDPVVRHLWPGSAQRHWALPRYFRTVLTHHHIRGGGVEVAGTGSGTIVGVALWDPPGRWETTAGELVRSAPQLALAFGHRLVRAMRTRSVFDRVHPSQPHWYLCNLAVLPGYQGRGVGTALLRSRCTRCDEAGEAAYLVCTRDTNVRLYSGAGFVPTASFQLPNGTPLWPMWRDPNPTAAQ